MSSSLPTQYDLFWIERPDKVVFSLRGHSSGPLDVRVRYHVLTPTRISGSILGTSAVFDALRELVGEPSCSMTSVLPDDWLRMSSETAHITRTSHNPDAKEAQTREAQFQVGEFDCDEILFERKATGSTEKRYLAVVFYVDGPRRSWGIGFPLMMLEPAAVQMKHSEERIELAMPCPFSVSVGYQFEYEPVDPKGSRRAVETVLTVRCVLEGEHTSRDDLALLSAAKTIVDDLTLLVSFIGGAWIRWYRYVSWTDHGYREGLRRVAPSVTCDDDDTLDQRTMIPRQWIIPKFLKTAVPRLRSLDALGVDLRLPITYLIASKSARYIEEQFAYAILALEKLADSYAREHGLTSLVPSDDFKKIRRLVRAVVKAAFRESSPDDVVGPWERSRTSQLMREKLSELNRPTLWAVLERALSELNVPWTDLYPENTQIQRRTPSFINARNRFIHSEGLIGPNRLGRELVRVRAISERIILRRLGWGDVGYTPGGREARRLQDAAEELDEGSWELPPFR